MEAGHLEEGTVQVRARTCGLGSAIGLVALGGELMAVPHRTALTGYKAPNAYGSRPTMSSETTYRACNKKVALVGERTGTRNKKLMPYYPWATRNRPTTTQQNIVGTRYGTHATSKERYKGSSTVSLSSGGIHADSPWRTTNQVFNECALVRDTVGLTNQGIASELAKSMHKKQGIYGK